MTQQLKPIGPFVKGMIVDYLQQREVRYREWLSARRWHVVHVAPQREGDVKDDIEALGMAGYVPMMPHIVCVSGGLRNYTVWRPLFPGYVFAAFDPNGTLWQSIRSRHIDPLSIDDQSGIEGVVWLFMLELRPLPLPDKVMRDIRDIEAELAMHGRRRKRVPLAVQVGTLLQITHPSPFAGLFGYVTAIDDKERSIEVEVDIFGRPTKVSLPPEHVQIV